MRNYLEGGESEVGVDLSIMCAPIRGVIFIVEKPPSHVLPMFSSIASFSNGAKSSVEAHGFGALHVFLR